MTTESRWRKLFHPHTSARVDPVIFYIKISGNVASIGRIPIPPFSTELNSTYRTHFNITCIINLTGSYSKFQLLSPPYSRQISKLSSKRRKEKGKEKSLFLSFFLIFPTSLLSPLFGWKLAKLLARQIFETRLFRRKKEGKRERKKFLPLLFFSYSLDKLHEKERETRFRDREEQTGGRDLGQGQAGRLWLLGNNVKKRCM